MMQLRRGEYHSFSGGDARFLYLVPSAAVVRLDDVAEAVLETLADGDRTATELAESLSTRWGPEVIRSSIDELLGMRAIHTVAAPPPKPVAEKPKRRIPLQTLVLNVTSKCNLSCGYCYEYGEDRIVEAASKPRFMNEETARQSVDFMFSEAGDSPAVNLTFFGGETLLNFKMLKSALAYARERAVPLGKQVNASLTTNATLLREEIIDWIVENDVGVTVSIDGAREQQDKFRVFANGMGSYDLVVPNIKELLRRHRRRPVGARVTLTGQNLDVASIYRHLYEELGFWEVGFAPVTTSWQREYAIEDEGFRQLLSRFPDPRRGLSECGPGGPPSWILERARYARGDSQGHEQGVSVRRRARPHGRGHRRRRRALPSLRRIGHAQAGQRVRRHRSFASGRLPDEAPHRQQDGLLDVLGASAVRGRLLS